MNICVPTHSTIKTLNSCTTINESENIPLWSTISDAVIGQTDSE